MKASFLFLLLSLSSLFQAATAANKRIQAAGLEVNILGQSGKINLENKNTKSKVQITMDGLRELDANGNLVGKKGNPKHSINNFAQVEFAFSVSESDVPLYNETDPEQVIDIAKAVNIDFTATLDTGSKLTVEAFAVSEEGTAGDQAGNWTVAAGDFKWNILFDEWNWCDTNTCQEGEAAFVELDIEVKETDSDGSDAEAVGDGEEESYAISDSATLELTNGFTDEDGEVYEMPPGYPKITSNNGKTLFTFRFPRTKVDGEDVEQIIYDPVLRFMSSSSFAKVGVTATMTMLVTVAFLLS